MDKFSNEFLIRKEKIDFLFPYIAKVEAPAQQIPMMQLDAVPQVDLDKVILLTKFPAFYVSGILETSEMRIQVLEYLL